MVPIFIPYTYGDEVVINDEIGPLGYCKCSKCKKMSLHMMGEGTLQKRVDGFIPAGRKHKSYIIECKKCGNFFIPKPGKEEELIELAKKYPADIDFYQIESEVSDFYSENSKNYHTPDAAIEHFPTDCASALAKGKSQDYQKAVFDSAKAFIYNQAWRKSTMGKIEKKANILTAIIMIGIVALIIGAIAGIAALVRNLSK